MSMILYSVINHGVAIKLIIPKKNLYTCTKHFMYTGMYLNFTCGIKHIKEMCFD